VGKCRRDGEEGAVPDEAMTRKKKFEIKFMIY
jgi:hypothetical protein